MTGDKSRINLLGDWVAVPAQDVELEDGQIVRADACEIMKRSVSVRMFREFAVQTNYVTKAEQEVSDYESLTYWQNGYNADEVGIVGDDASACCVSRNDAEAFCRWAGVSLPSEAQWLAGFLVTDRLIEIDCFAAELAAGTIKRRLEGDGIELTGTLGLDGVSVIARSGPTVAKDPGWHDERSDHVFLLKDRDSYEEAIGFRCIR